MPPPSRRPATLLERSTPCENCGFPLSHRHHVLPIAKYGESELTFQLCPNCHHLYHLIASAYAGNKESQKLLKPFMRTRDLCDRYFMPLQRLYHEARKLNDATQQCTNQMVNDWEAIQRRLASGESIDEVSADYWRKVGVDWFEEPEAANGDRTGTGSKSVSKND